MSDETMRRFDLNIERVLEHWTVAHAVRELIANALDEAVLTSTQEPEIFKDSGGAWHIRDFGRGLCYEHLTQNENAEKLAHADIVIGKFGVGLKDALATFDRHDVAVTLRSRHCDIAIGKTAKHGFEDLQTLHALIKPPSEPDLTGTEAILDGLDDGSVEQAKSYFLVYSGDELLEQTKYGAVLRRAEGSGRIYVTGLLVATEENFLFSYNVTSLTAALRRALNRERTNVGRSAYSERVKSILLDTTEPTIAQALADEIARFQQGETHDEIKWTDVQVHAGQILNATKNVVFVTAEEVYRQGDLVNHADADGHEIVVVPDSLASKLSGLRDKAGEPVRTLHVYNREYSQSFKFDFVAPDELDPEEQAVFDKTDSIFALVGSPRSLVEEVRVSRTMRTDSAGFQAAGLWEPTTGLIVVKRDQLSSLPTYAGVLLHEIVHARSGTVDRTREFESELSDALGWIAGIALCQSTPD